MQDGAGWAASPGWATVSTEWGIVQMIGFQALFGERSLSLQKNVQNTSNALGDVEVAPGLLDPKAEGLNQEVWRCPPARPASQAGAASPRPTADTIAWHQEASPAGARGRGTGWTPAWNWSLSLCVGLMSSLWASVSLPNLLLCSFAHLGIRQVFPSSPLIPKLGAFP